MDPDGSGNPDPLIGAIMEILPTTFFVFIIINLKTERCRGIESRPAYKLASTSV
jgi:hypothetical protein